VRFFSFMTELLVGQGALRPAGRGQSTARGSSCRERSPERHQHPTGSTSSAVSVDEDARCRRQVERPPREAARRRSPTNANPSPRPGRGRSAGGENAGHRRDHEEAEHEQARPRSAPPDVTTTPNVALEQDSPRRTASGRAPRARGVRS
jgi:hypothetical protein